MEAVIVGDRGRKVASSSGCRITVLPGSEWGSEEMHCYFFGRLSLSPPVLFEHLAGTGLAKFLQNAAIYLDGEPLDYDLHYVHGRSEVMRGKSFISSVLLARTQPRNVMGLLEWMSSMPGIYKKYLENSTVPSENS